MNLPELGVDDLARLRLQECQGTLIGGMKVAVSLGIGAEEFGFRMMMEQGINWSRLCGDLERIARIFFEHYQVTYGFGAALQIALDDNMLRFTMPALEDAAGGQLQHWQMAPAMLHDLNRGFWRALTENAGVTVMLEFTPQRHTVTVQRG